MRRYKLKKMKRVHGLHFTPCGTQLLACVGTDKSRVTGAVLLDLATGDERARIEQQGTCYAVPPDVSRFVLGGATNAELSGIVWANLPDLARWERQRWLKRSTPPIYSRVCGLSFDPTGTRLAVAHSRVYERGRQSVLRLHLSITDPDTGEEELTLPAPRYTSELTFSDDGSRLAGTGGASAPEYDAIVYDVAARAEVFRFRPPGTSTPAARFLPDGRLAVANGCSVFVLCADGKQQLRLTGHAKPVNALALAPNGERLLSGSHDGTVRAWDLRTGETVAAFEWRIGPVTALACAPDGLTCAAAGTGGQVVLWDADG